MQTRYQCLPVHEDPVQAVSVQNPSLCEYLQDPRLDLLGRARGVNKKHAPRVTDRQEPVSLSDPAVKLQVFFFEASPDLASRIACSCPFEGWFHIDIQDQGKVGHRDPQNFSQPVYQIEPDSSGVPLIGESRVMIPVAEYMKTGLEGRFDSLLEVLVPVG